MFKVKPERVILFSKPLSAHYEFGDLNRCQTRGVATDILPHVVQCTLKRLHDGMCKDPYGFYMGSLAKVSQRAEVARGFRKSRRYS